MTGVQLLRLAADCEMSARLRLHLKRPHVAHGLHAMPPRSELQPAQLSLADAK
jgi:hypothetical protein